MALRAVGDALLVDWLKWSAMHGVADVAAHAEALWYRFNPSCPVGLPQLEQWARADRAAASAPAVYEVTFTDRAIGIALRRKRASRSGGDAGEATVEQIDTAIVNGPGPRWAIMGPCMVYHVGGGEGGMRYCLEQFGPALKFPWTRLVAPELTPELTEVVVEGAEKAAGGQDFRTLTREMNTGLVAIAKALGKARRKG
jgi:hypothetical protein